MPHWCGSGKARGPKVRKPQNEVKLLIVVERLAVSRVLGLE
jgi:hypothetical protein